jgi:two-component system NarL family response regulator
VVLTPHIGDERIDSALEAGAMACLVKDEASRDLVPAIRAVRRQQPFIPEHIDARVDGCCAQLALSRREIEVLELIADGKENKEISGHLRISYQTVKVHVRAILLKLGVSNRTHAVSVAVRRGILDLAH